MKLEHQIARILLFPPTFALGVFVGMVAGAVCLPHLLFQEIMRRGEASFPYLKGWNAWSVRWNERGKLGWYAIWVGWIVFWGVSAFSWAPFVGAIAGGAFVVYALFVPDGAERARAFARRKVERIRNTKIEIRVHQAKTSR